jgi:hypothetical protein
MHLISRAGRRSLATARVWRGNRASGGTLKTFDFRPELA